MRRREVEYLRCVFLSLVVCMGTAVNAGIPAGHFTAVRPVLADPAHLDFNPTVTADGLTLVFSSNDRGGFGNIDLTPGHEISVHITPTWPARGSKIYFTADRTSRADVFQATWVPEPSTALLSVLGLPCILGIAGRSRHARLRASRGKCVS